MDWFSLSRLEVQGTGLARVRAALCYACFVMIQRGGIGSSRSPHSRVFGKVAAACRFASYSIVSAGVLLPWQTRIQKARTVVSSSTTTAQRLPIAGVMWMR